MIKINLANSLIAKSGGVSLGAQIAPKQLAIKIALLILPLVAVIMWEHKSINDKKAQLEDIKHQSQELDKRLASHGDVSDTVSTVNKQKKDLDEKFNVIRQIFTLRSQKMQTLFALEDKVGAKTWLTQILVHDKTVSVSGYATTIDEVGAFAQTLGGMTDLFASVNTTNTNSEKVNGSEFFKFDIFIKLKE